MKEKLQNTIYTALFEITNSKLSEKTKGDLSDLLIQLMNIQDKNNKDYCLAEQIRKSNISVHSKDLKEELFNLFFFLSYVKY